MNDEPVVPAKDIQKRHFDAAQPYKPRHFSIGYRNPGHFDVYARDTPGRIAAWLAENPGSSTTARDDDRTRVFRIRGGPGDVVVYDERWNPHKPHPRPDVRFATVAEAVVWISEELGIE